jgi:hypothetical protein
MGQEKRYNNLSLEIDSEKKKREILRILSPQLKLD